MVLLLHYEAPQNKEGLEFNEAHHVNIYAVLIYWVKWLP
jgi:hypothetical protein